MNVNDHIILSTHLIHHCFSFIVSEFLFLFLAPTSLVTLARLPSPAVTPSNKGLKYGRQILRIPNNL